MNINDAFLDKVSDYIPSIAYKWDFIGIKLHESDLVCQLRQSDEDDEAKMLLVLSRWIESAHTTTDVRQAFKELVDVLNSPAVNLGRISNDIELKELIPSRFPTSNQKISKQEKLKLLPDEQKPQGSEISDGRSSVVNTHLQGLATVSDKSSENSSISLPITLPNRKIAKDLPDIGTVAKLGFAFSFMSENQEKMYGLPTGLFNEIVIGFLDSKTPTSQKWVNFPKHSNHSTLKLMGKHNYSTIYLTQKADYIELLLLVHANTSKNKLPKICSDLKAEMEERIYHASKKIFGEEFLMDQQKELMMGVPCTLSNCQTDSTQTRQDPHLLFFITAEAGMCMKTENVKAPLSPNETIWMTREATIHKMKFETRKLEGIQYLKYTGLLAVGIEPTKHSTPNNNKGPGRGFTKDVGDFLRTDEFLEKLRECDIRGLGPDLLSKGVIDLNEASDIGHNKGMKVAANNLYMILQRDKCTLKLEALMNYLYADTTKGTFKILADMISEFLRTL